ncbi:membrane-bound alkaline phosphatase-like [Haematobia irritans]|uniref:membrane-bound alkaline phosphatase-like n=1 Tax=Haematobia irritans TaxID=7368 RepID=UPI003F4F6A5F
MKAAFLLLTTFVVLVVSHQYKDLHSTLAEQFAGHKVNGPSSRIGMPVAPVEERNREFWLNLGQGELLQRVQKPLNQKQAKNVIFFLGGGMSLTTLTASRIRKGQLKGNHGEEELLSFEKFPFTGLSKCAHEFCSELSDMLPDLEDLFSNAGSRAPIHNMVIWMATAIATQDVLLWHHVIVSTHWDGLGLRIKVIQRCAADTSCRLFEVSTLALHSLPLVSQLPYIKSTNDLKRLSNVTPRILDKNSVPDILTRRKTSLLRAYNRSALNSNQNRILMNKKNNSRAEFESKDERNEDLFFVLTYCVNAQVPDSACTSTAYLSGVKANLATLGVTAQVNYNNCTESMDKSNQVSSIADWAQKAGKSTGFITTTTLTHATPAGSYAHVANSFWESDTDVTTSTGLTDTSKCMDIAQQLITREPGKKFNVLMGGGMGKFLPNTIRDSHGNMGERSDGKNLLSTWQADHKKGLLVTDRSGLLSVDTKKHDNIMGIFASGLMDFHVTANSSQQPTLEEMTEVAIQVLKKNNKGYFIFIEGGLIDHGHHANMPAIAIDETLEFEKAVQKARDLTDPNDTLIVVSSDHAHPMSIAGYPSRGNNILGIGDLIPDRNGMPLATLNYAAGPYQYLDEQGNRLDLSSVIDGENMFAQYPSYIKKAAGVHSGDDVGIFASGPHEHLFRSSLEQHTLPHLMAYAACIGDGPTLCSKNKL